MQLYQISTGSMGHHRLTKTYFSDICDDLSERMSRQIVNEVDLHCASTAISCMVDHDLSGSRAASSGGDLPKGGYE
jgi:hypothetical protein